MFMKIWISFKKLNPYDLKKANLKQQQTPEKKFVGGRIEEKNRLKIQSSNTELNIHTKTNKRQIKETSHTWRTFCSFEHWGGKQQKVQI